MHQHVRGCERTIGIDALKRLAIGPNWTAWLDAAFQALASTPLRTTEKFAAIVLIDGHVRAAAQISVGAVGEWQENFSQVLASAESRAISYRCESAGDRSSY